MFNCSQPKSSASKRTQTKIITNNTTAQVSNTMERCILNIPAFLQLCCFTTHFQEANSRLTPNAHDNQRRYADDHTWQHKPSELRHLLYEPDDHDANILVRQDIPTYCHREATGTKPTFSLS
jgi:hypothetical protein